MTESATSPKIEHYKKGPSVTVKYENDRTFHKSKVRGGRDWWWAWSRYVWVHRSAYTQWLLERGESKQFSGPPSPAKNMRKKLLKIRKIVETQEKHRRKDVNASAVSLTCVN